MTAPLESKPVYTKKQIIWRVLLMICLIAVTVLLIVHRDEVQHLQALGYPGIFLFSMLSNATLLLPLPGVLFTSAMGGVFNPFWVAIAAGTGAAVGELSGYLAGVSGQVVVDKSPRYQKIYDWMQKNGSWTILALAFIPNPLFDVAGFVAGSMKIPIWKFLILSVIGKVCKMLLFAYLGSGVIAVFE